MFINIYIVRVILGIYHGWRASDEYGFNGLDKKIKINKNNKQTNREMCKTRVNQPNIILSILSSL